MKKVILGFAACAFILASCSQNDILENTEEGNVISFSNLNDRVTKAANEKNDNYAVYAVRSNASDVWFMDKVRVENDIYSPLRYWPTGGATVNFYAYASFWGGASVKTDTVGSLPVTYTVPVNADEDFTIATPVLTASGPATVNLSFNHMLSKITVDAKLTSSLDSAGYSVSFASATLGVANNTGTGNLTTNPLVDFTEGGSAASYSGKKSYMFIPQTSTGTTLQLKGVVIKHNGVEYWAGDLKKYIIAANNITGNRFVRNTHYTINFTIDQNANDGQDPTKPVFGKAITFSSSVADWATGTTAVTQP